MPDFYFDLHTHTIASGHGSSATITQMARAAKEKGLKFLGISDHGPATIGGGRESYFRSLSFAPRKRAGLNLLFGAEVNILDAKGNLDLSDNVLSGLDYVIASLHRPVKKPGSIDENTACYIEAMKNPYVKLIGHCDDTHYPVDHLALVQAALKHQVYLEINNSSLRPDGYRGDTRFNCLMMLNLCRHYQYPVVLSSDSHGTGQIGDFSYGWEMLKKAAFPAGLVLNCQPGKPFG